jgi:lipopolysaccharide transport system permease protein
MTTRTEIETIDWPPVLLYGDLVRYSDLFLNLFRRELRVKYRGSLLGLAWTLINPVVLMFGYWLLFSILLRAVSIEHYPLFVISGLVSWIFFQSAVQMSASSLLGQSNLVKQVRFPRQLLPLSVVATNLVTMGVMLAVVIPINLLFVPETRSTVWLTFPMLVPLIALTSGLAIVVAAATVIFRDVEHLLTAVFLPWFVLTPIFYTFDQLPGIEGNQLAADALYYGNFMAPVVEAVRDPLFFGEVPALGDIVYSGTAALLALAAGALVFRRLDDRLAAEL